MQTTSNGSAATTPVGAERTLPGHMNGATSEESPSFESNVILRRPKTDQKQTERRQNHLIESERERSPEQNPGRRMTPESLNELRFASRKDEDDFYDDDGQSSVCSDMVFFGGGGGGEEDAAKLSTKYSTLDRNFKTRKTESLVEALEKQRRESVGNRLKELHRTTTRRTSMFSAINEMPVIAKRSPSGDSLLPLPRQTTRRASYQSVIGGPSFLSSASQSRLLGSGAALDRLERRNSITGPRVQTPTRLYFPLRETESLSGMEHFVEPPEQFSSTRRCGAHSQLDGGGVEQSAPSRGVNRESQPIEATTTRRNDDDDDDDDDNTAKSDDRRIIVANDDDSESKRFCLGEESSEWSRETDRRCKEYEEMNDKAEGFPPAVPSIPNEGSSFCEGMASTEDHADIRINGSSSSSSSSSSLGANDGTSHAAAGLRAVETPDSVESHKDDDETKVKQPTCSSKTEEGSPVDIGVCIAAAPKSDETASKATDVPKGNSYYSPKEEKKYYSDIHIQLKETHSPLSRNHGANENSSMQNGDLPAAASNGRETNDDDDDDDDDDGESDAEIAENITPNWSSYPGPLLDSSPADNSNFEDEATDIIPKRNISTLEINVNCANNSDSNSDRRPDDDRLNACRSVDTVSQAPTNTGDQVNGNRVRDSDLSYCSHAYLRRDVNERSTGPEEDQPQTSFGFYGNRPNAIQTNDCRRGLDGSRSTERKEVFLVESVNPRTQALPRDQRSRNANHTGGGRSCDGGFPQRNSSLASQNGGGRENRTPCSGQESVLSRTDAARTFCSKLEDAASPAAATDDQPRTRPTTTAVNGGMSESSVMHLKSSDNYHRTDGSFKGSGGGGSSSSSETPPPPPTPSSVDRIWESVEETRPRMLRRKIRFEFDSESLPPSGDSGQRSRASSDCEEVKGVAERTTMMTMKRSLSTEENGVRRRSSAALEAGGELLDIDVPKGGLGLGFCIEGGKDGPYGDRPITVKRLFRVSSDPKASGSSGTTLCPGDEIISANGKDMTFLSRYVAWNYLKTLPEGTMKLVIRRRQQKWKEEYD